MKRLVISIGMLCVGFSFIFAQDHYEALKFSQHTTGGTARSVAMGGAFGALGGDFSSLSSNPAGLGIYRSSEFTFTPEFYNSSSSTRYFGNEVKESKFNFNFSNLGYVGVYEQKNSSLKSVNFGIGFNRIANFHQNTVTNGDNPYTSYADYMASDATTYGFNDYFSYFTSAQFYDAGVINESTDDASVYLISDDYLNTDGSFRSTEQYITNNQKGKINEWVFSLGFNFSDAIYVGGTVGIQPLVYSSDKITREYRASDRDYNYFNFNETLDIRGTGYTAKVGAIFRPISMLRLGIAFHLPVVYRLESEYTTSISSQYSNGTLYPVDNDGYRVDALISEYAISTPYKAIGSAAVVLGKILVLSADVEYLDYSSMRMSSKYIDFADQNQLIREVYSNNVNIKTGAELRMGNTYFRGGFGYYGSAYAADQENADAIQMSYSGGFGVRDNNMFFDVAFQYTNYEEISFLYTAYDGDDIERNNSANMDVSNSRLMATIGFKF